MRSFLKFGALSGGGWLLDCMLLLVMSQSMGMSLMVANFISSSVAALTVFTVSRFLVFNSSAERPVFKTFIYFCYTCCVIVAASLIIGPAAWAAKTVAAYVALTLSAGQVSFLAKVLVTPPQLLANFLMSRYLAEYTQRGAEIVR